jgi:hypothetical protein
VSGQLVGEVIAASAELKERGLSERGFHALIAIADRCGTQTRQGSVAWSYISAGLYDASKRTAERAVQDLKRIGVLRVVKPGFNNNHGRMCAPIYEVQALTDTDTQVSASIGGDTDKSGDRYRQIGDRYRHPGVVLNGSTNGSTNAAAAVCTPCNGGGWVLGPDGTPQDPAVKCSCLLTKKVS